jgi:hypothetical protein
MVASELGPGRGSHVMLLLPTSSVVIVALKSATVSTHHLMLRMTCFTPGLMHRWIDLVVVDYQAVVEQSVLT